MTDKSLDVTGLGKVAQAIPEEAWKRLVDTACNTFEQCLAPITATTSGIGRLIEAKFDRLAAAEKILAADILERATRQANNSKVNPNPEMKAKIVISVLEEAGTQTDVNLRELWVNLLAHEIVSGDVHPEIVRILSRISAQDANVLAKISTTSTDNTFTIVRKSFLKSLDTSLSVSILGVILHAKKTKHSNISEALLENLRLIEKQEGDWVLSAIGKEFIRAVSKP